MNQLNPLHIGLLLVVLISFLFFKLHGVQEELVEAKRAFSKSEKLAVDLNALKSVYANKKRTEASLKRILAQNSIRSANLDVKYEKSFVKIVAATIDTKALNSLMGKILNGSYNIKELKIKKLSETKASLQLEIKW